MRDARVLQILLFVWLLSLVPACAQTPAGPLSGHPGESPLAGIERGDSNEPLVILADLLHTQGKKPDGSWQEPIQDGALVIEGGKITAIGAREAIDVPAGARTVRAPVVTPGLIDARSVVGLAGWLNYDHDQDQLEDSEPIQPELRAIDAYNGREPLIEWIRSFGVTTLHTGHAPGQLISGQTMIVKTRTGELEPNLINPLFSVAATLGDDSLAEGSKSPGTRAKQISMLRQVFTKAQEYREKVARAAGDEEKQPSRDLRQEILGRVLAGEIPLMVTCHRSVDIQNALRLAQEFNLKLILDGASESFEHLEAIREAGVPVFLHAPMIRASGEARNASMSTASKLIDAGIPCALESGYESYVPKTRVVLFEAAIACAFGCSFSDALGMVTLSAAEILGISDRVGSLEVGKDADVALYDGDPFEYTTHCIGVFIEGEIVSDIVR